MADELIDLLEGINAPQQPGRYSQRGTWLPDLSGVPAFGRRGPEAVLREFGPDIAMDAAMTAIPALRGVSPLARALMAGGAGGTALLAPTEAGSGSEATKDPRLLRLQALDKEIADHRAKLEKMATTNFQSKTARENASKPFLDAIDLASRSKAALEKELDAEASALANSSFAKAHPALNAAWPAIMWGGPVAAAMLTRGAGNLAERGLTGPWRSAVRKAEEGISTGNPMKAGYHSGKAQEHLALQPNSVMRKAEDFMRETAIPTAAGAGVGMEAALFRSQYDRGNAPVGSKEQLAAEKALGEDFWSTAMKGLAPGVLGGFTGAHLPNIGAGYRPVAETRNLKSFLDDGVVTSRPPQVSSAPSAQLLPASPAPAALEPERPRLVDRLMESRQAQQLPAGPSANQRLIETLRSPANTNKPKNPIRGKDSQGREYHKDPDNGRFTEKPDND